jgi:hypothetical protein
MRAEPVTLNDLVEIGDQPVIRFAWSPAAGLVHATFRAEVERYEPKGDRFQCKLIELVEVSGIQSHQQTGIVPSGSALTREMIDRLIGQHVLVPREGLNGLTLRLKMTTLTGGLKHPYFFAE